MPLLAVEPLPVVAGAVAAAAGLIAAGAARGARTVAPAHAPPVAAAATTTARPAAPAMRRAPAPDRAGRGRTGAVTTGSAAGVANHWPAGSSAGRANGLAPGVGVEPGSGSG